MARTPCPWYRSERAEWCVTIRGRHHRLGPHPAGFPAPRKQRGRWNVPQPILDQFDELKVGLRKAPGASAVPQAPPGLTVAELFDRFLDWCQQRRSARTYEWYKGHIQSFIDVLPEPNRTPAADLRPFHPQAWTDAHPTWGDSHRRGAMIAILRPFNWATRLGLLTTNPVRGVDLPPARRRESRLTPADFAVVLEHVKDPPFRDLLTFAWETGCRPQEARQVEARHVRLDARRVEIPPAEAKGRRRWRVIYLSDAAVALVKRLLATRPDGKLFRNTDGNPWTVHAVNCRFGRLKAKVGRRFAAYDFRHAFATRKLKEGVDPITLAGLLGHKDPTMLCRHYEHVTGDARHLLDAVNRPPAPPSR